MSLADNPVWNWGCSPPQNRGGTRDPALAASLERPCRWWQEEQPSLPLAASEEGARLCDRRVPQGTRERNISDPSTRWETWLRNERTPFPPKVPSLLLLRPRAYSRSEPPQPSSPPPPNRVCARQSSQAGWGRFLPGGSQEGEGFLGRRQFSRGRRP